MENARRHATRVTFVDGEKVHVYFAQRSARDVDLLGPRPKGEFSLWHRADSCECPVLWTETAAEWNADYPRRGEPKRWAVLYRWLNRPIVDLSHFEFPKLDF
jgi:hypothetical protein